MKKSSRKKSRIIFNIKNPSQKSFKNLGVFLILALMLAYVFQVTEMAREIHTVQVYNKEIRDVSERNRRNEYDFLKANSVVRAQELVEDLNFVKVEEAHYIKVLDNQMASK
jgi:hypothetical protein